MAEYELYLSTALGVRIAPLTRWTALTWSLSANGIGQVELALPAHVFDRGLYAVDRRLEVWRQPTGGAMGLAGVYLLRAVERATETAQSVTLRGPSVDDLLDRRIVAYPAGSAQANKTGPADDLMKAFVRENLGSLATVAARDLSAMGFSVQGDLGQAPEVTKGCAWRHLFPVLQELAETSAALGTPLWFRIAPVAGGLELQTRVGQPGADRTGMAQPFSLESGALANARLVEDWRDEANHIYGTGQGIEDAREVVEVVDAEAQTASPYNRREALADGRTYSTTAGLTAFANNRLREGRARRTFMADLLDVPGARLGVDWEFGDRVVAQYEEERFEAVVTALRVSVQRGAEAVAARLEWSE